MCARATAATRAASVMPLVQFVACNCNLADNFIDSLTFRLIAVGKRVLHVFSSFYSSSACVCLITMRSLFWYFFSIFSISTSIVNACLIKSLFTLAEQQTEIADIPFRFAFLFYNNLKFGNVAFLEFALL